MLATRAWFILMALSGIGFGLIRERRPFGNDFLAHPLVAYFIAVGAGLLILRMAAARPVPELISERALVIGCFIGVAAFLAGNWIATRL